MRWDLSSDRYDLPLAQAVTKHGEVRISQDAEWIERSEGAKCVLREEVPLAVDGLGKRKICDEYAELDAGIIAAHQKNRGLSGARNNGL